MTSIVVVTHNALPFIVRLFMSLRRTVDAPYEVVVVDNRSRPPARVLLQLLCALGRINRLILLDRNTMFAEANNIGVAASARESQHVLLLNSDVEIVDPRWLADLLALHERGATAYGFVKGDPIDRADGYCMLLDRDVYERFGLDESFPWWWSVTRLQAELLGAGCSVKAVPDHDHKLVHFGGGSGRAWKSARGVDVTGEEVCAWFDGHAVEVVAAPGTEHGRARLVVLPALKRSALRVRALVRR